MDPAVKCPNIYQCIDRAQPNTTPAGEVPLTTIGSRRPIIQRPSVRRPRPADVLAGFSVALVLIPQSLAYAQIAEMPVVTGLFASALPLIAAAPFGSSPYLQTGPVALTSLLTLAALQGAGFAAEDPNYVALGSLLALIVGVSRLLLGLVRGGWAAYLIASPVMQGFTSAAALIIMSSQLPKALGTNDVVPDGSTIGEALWTITHPGQWSGVAIGISAMTLLLMLGGRRLHRLFPGVAIAVVAGLVISGLLNDPGSVVGRPVGIPQGLPSLSFDLPWSSLGTLIVSGIVIALVGFAEPSAIARLFASEDGVPWDANKELIGSGFGNLASAISGAFPVGGSFSRSSVNRLAGAETRWSGGFTGLVVLAFLPFASILDPLPQAVLGAIVVGAVLGLLKPKVMLAMHRSSPLDALLAWTTFVAALVLAPNVQYAVLIGVALSAAVHFLRPLRLEVTERSDDATHLRPQGLLWLGSYNKFDELLTTFTADHAGENLVVDLGPDPALDPAIEQTIDQARKSATENGGSLALSHQLTSG